MICDDRRLPRRGVGIRIGRTDDGTTGTHSAGRSCPIDHAAGQRTATEPITSLPTARRVGVCLGRSRPARGRLSVDRWGTDRDRRGESVLACDPDPIGTRWDRRSIRNDVP
ncbi:hypothetical protein [Halovivax asiaticus]|uniref:hypothetical protein n=1 Tax=Halovivax asiaticus TaxID=332953 RepID=UPI001F4CED88|nr:hypothetical protein [Halovivax asiaticus]